MQLSARHLSLLLCLAPFLANAQRRIPAFPGAEGGGAAATGGRGGKICEVTTLADSGPGSLRDAVSQKGPRIVIFRVAGTIELESKLSISEGDITIAGQSAPGGGICLKNYGLVASGLKNAIIRHLRVRPGDGAKREMDAVTGGECERVIFDHISASWSVDETFSLYGGCRDVTVQWCLISESLFRSAHSKGEHGYGGIWGGERTSWHHNLLAHHTSRNPRIARTQKDTDVRNNVIYNWGFNSIYGGENSTINIVANYFKPGPATKDTCRERFVEAEGKGGRWFVERNELHGVPDLTDDNWQGGIQHPWGGEDAVRSLRSFPAAHVTTQDAPAACELVLANCGATLPKRDALDARIVVEVRSGKASFGQSFQGGKNGIIDSPEDVGGWPPLPSEPPPSDSDHDGMPDAWETKNKLNPNTANDGPADADADGYTNVEEFLNDTDPQKFAEYSIPSDPPAVEVHPQRPARFWRDELNVAADGSGDVKTIQQGVDGVPTNRKSVFIVRIRPGVYDEAVVIPPDKPWIEFRSSDPATTILRFAAKDGKPRAALTVFASDFAAEKLTIEGAATALAASVSGDRAAFRKCQFRSAAGALKLTSPRCWLSQCGLEGGGDLLSSSGAVWFEKGTLHFSAPGTAAASATPPECPWGIVLTKSTISSNPDSSRFLLARADSPAASFHFIKSELASSPAAPTWALTEGVAQTGSLRFGWRDAKGEFPSHPPDWVRKLTDDQADAATEESVIRGVDAWKPFAK